MANTLMNGVKRPTDISLKWLDAPLATFPDGFRLVVPNVTDVTLGLGVSVQEVFMAAPDGTSVLADLLPDQQNPTIAATFPKKSMVTMGMLMNRRPIVRDGEAINFARNGMRVVGSGSYPAAVAGEEGFGVVADEPEATAAVLDPVTGLSEQLTQETFATFDAATATMAFAVGANMALKFSNDVIGKYVSFDIPALGDGVVTLSEEGFGRFQATLIVIEDDRTLLSIRFPEVIVDRSAGDINFAEPSQAITFRPTYDGSSCQYVQVKRTLRRRCVEPIAA